MIKIFFKFIMETQIKSIFLILYVIERNEMTKKRISIIANCSLLTAKETQIKSTSRHSRGLLAGISAVFTDEMPDY